VVFARFAGRHSTRGGGRSVATRAEERERYEWLRPLELMWIARTIALAKDTRGRALAGQRRVRPWYEDDAMRTDRFGMSEEQFRAYRQAGMYAHTVLRRKWPGMTRGGDGWTPDLRRIRLAKWLDDRLGGSHEPLWQLHVSDGDPNSLSTRSAKLGRGDECRWWLRHWSMFYQGGRKR